MTWWHEPGWAVEPWIADVQATGADVLCVRGEVAIKPSLASGYVPPWVCSEAWQLRDVLRDHFARDLTAATPNAPRR